MATIKINGRCLFCNGEFTTTVMKNHLPKCKARLAQQQDSQDKQEYYCILAKGQYAKEYWIYFDLPVKATLKDLDSFLRGIWLECCGHLSDFKINGRTYAISPDSNLDEYSMVAKIDKIVDVGDQFIHTYDYGTTTSLLLKVISRYLDSKRSGKVRLLAQNIAPDIRCDFCGKKADLINVEDRSCWCEECADNPEFDEDMALPVVNSPRVGECGYTGGMY